MPTYQLTLRSEFSAAHRLRLLDGSLEPLHGHNWLVEVVLEGDKLDGMEVLADFTVLQPELRRITGAMHDTFLNELAPFRDVNPSTERVAKHIHDEFKPRLPKTVRIVEVKVWETRDCAAAYVP